MNALLIIAFFLLVLHLVKLRVTRREDTVQAKYKRIKDRWFAIFVKDFCDTSLIDVARLIAANDGVWVAKMLWAHSRIKKASRILMPDSFGWRPALLALRQIRDLEDAEEALDEAASLLGMTDWKPAPPQLIDVALMVLSASG